MEQYKQLVSINHQGVVIVFGRPSYEGSTDIYYNILDPDKNTDDNGLSWEGFKKLEFTTQVRQVGMGIITLGMEYSTMTCTAAPFRVVTDQKYISVVQQSELGTLYINRFVLIKTKSGTDQKEVVYLISPAWEVRYSRSGKEDIPADKSDTQKYLTPDDKPFLEPSLELSMVSSVSEGAFDLVLLPISGSELYAWQFFILNKPINQISLYNFTATSNGLPDVSGKTVGSDFKILADSSFDIAYSSEEFNITSAPRAIVYTKHENVLQPDGKSIGVKRASRVMIAIPGSVGDNGVAVTVDSAVGTNGTIAKLRGSVEASEIFPVKFELLFDVAGSLSLKAASTNSLLKIDGAYTMKFIVKPMVLKNDLLIIGGSDQSDTKTLAPYAKVVEGGKLQVGFGDGTKEIYCKTQKPIFVIGSWTGVELEYAGKGDNPFTVTVNGTVVPVTPCKVSAEPCGKDVDTVGSQTNGFIGAVKSIVITNAGTKAVDLACEDVNYSDSWPLTPNSVSPGVVAEAHGPKLVPSLSPTDISTSGAFYIDDTGLTYYAGLASFISPLSATCLMSGSDGLLHLYYKGKDNKLSVAQYSTLSARATFYTEWRSMSVNGFLNFQAQRVGIYMNNCSIVVSPSRISDILCDITVTGSDDIGVETWRGLPRSIAKLAQVWNGVGASNPDNGKVTSGIVPYFNYNSDCPSVVTSSTNSESGGYFQFISTPPLDLASVEITSVANSGVVNLNIESAAPAAWSGKTVKQTWPNVTASPFSAIEILSGKSTAYDYAQVITEGTKAYGIPAVTLRSDEQVSTISVFVQDSLKDFELAVANSSSPAVCNVTICQKILTNVARDQNSFVRILNGEDLAYEYPDGYKEEIASKIYTVSNGLTASVQNCDIQSQDIAGALPYARLLRLIYTGESHDRGYMMPKEKTAAETIQGAMLTFKEKNTNIERSLLFSVILGSLPTNGETAMIQDTASLTGGKAAILEYGVNGGWMPQPPRFCLRMNKGSTNYVSYNIGKEYLPSQKLAVSGDLTLQTWINQNTLVNNSSSRIITYNYNDAGVINNPALPAQYVAGSKQMCGLILKKGTFVRSSYAFTPNFTMQIYIKPINNNFNGSIYKIAENSSGGAVFLQLWITDAGVPNLLFMDEYGIPGGTPLTIGKFICLTVTVADMGNNRVSISLYYNADAPVKGEFENTFTGKTAALTIGSEPHKPLEMTVNGAALWRRTLTDKEVQDSYNHGFADNDKDLDIRWNFTEGSGLFVKNSASTGSEYDSEVKNPSGWDFAGAFFVPYMGRNNYILQSDRFLKGWTNIAFASKQGYAIKLDGSNFGVVSSGDSVKPGSSFAIEVWIKPETLTRKQVIVEKPGSYTLYTDSLGYVCLSTSVVQDGKNYDSVPIAFDYIISANKIAAGKTSYLAVNFTTGTVKQALKGSQEPASPKYYIYSSLYIDGLLVENKNNDSYESSVRLNQQDSAFYIGVSGNKTFNWTGLLSNIRVWGRTLNKTEIKSTAELHLPPTDKNGLIAMWNFDENTGTLARDGIGSNNMQLSSNQLWTVWQDVSYANIYVNGTKSIALRLTPSDVGDYHDTQFTIGGVLKASVLTLPYSGDIDDIRLYSTLLTEKQILESMSSYLFGNEDNLTAYWRMDEGSGLTLFDMTGRGNNGVLMPAKTPPAWNVSEAPICNEGPSVVNVLGGLDSGFTAQIDEEPSVIEYGSSEKDAYGNIIGVMKRCYAYLSVSKKTFLELEYKVGDLKSIYIGQVQSKPSVVGFIEGGPPIPSENQTLPYWESVAFPGSEYDTACSVTYQESETKIWTFSGAQSSTFEGSLNFRGGYCQFSQTGTSVGLGAEVDTTLMKDHMRLGLNAVISGILESTDSVNQSHENVKNLYNTYTPTGTWESADNILNIGVGRRYIQNNTGIAVVKSSVADLYMLALKGKSTPVTYTLVPNSNIPIDTNIIEFPINPKYVKNGTLDGKVGLANDPDYPYADTEKGSYFKPVEAYAVKQKIEKEEEQLKAYYDRFSQDKYKVIFSLDSVKDYLKGNTFYDFDKKMNKRNIFNNYVWSAGGGMHKEEHSVANSYSESYTGSSSLRIARGGEFSFNIATPGGGCYFEADALYGITWHMTATKSEAASNNFSLICNVNPTSNLCAPVITKNYDTGRPECAEYGKTPAPGKVNSYRFMSFFLAPSNENFKALTDTVIDRNWLANSNTQAASAMREAVADENGAWRIMYRTTFVSRVQAPFQVVQNENVSPNVVVPANMEANCWLISIIKKLIGKEEPTPLDIGQAVERLLGKDSINSGILGIIIPWWGNFLSAAGHYGTKEFKALSEFREDILQYLINVYDTNKHLKN